MANGDKPPGGAVIIQVTTETPAGNATQSITIQCKHAAPGDVASKVVSAIEAIKQEYEKDDDKQDKQA